MLLARILLQFSGNKKWPPRRIHETAEKKTLHDIVSSKAQHCSDAE